MRSKFSDVIQRSKYLLQLDCLLEHEWTKTLKPSEPDRCILLLITEDIRFYSKLAVPTSVAKGRAF